MDYYSILELKRDSGDADIKKAYRRLAVQWHPDRDESKGKEEVQAKFRALSEAYRVLQDAKLRAIFDQYGEVGLKTGMPNGKGGYVGAWAYNDDPVEQFSKFFGSFSPFADYFNEDAGYARLFNSSGNKMDGKQGTQTLNLYCSLEELSQGCLKKQKIVRQKLKSDGKETESETRIMSVDVRPGWREGTKITFKNEGDEAFETETGDVVFILKQKPHPRFTRVKNDLHYTATLDLVQALTGVNFTIEMLDGRVLPISVSDVVRPGTQKRIPNEGMPLPANPSEKGSLVINFDVKFPEVLTEQQKINMKQVLA